MNLFISLGYNIAHAIFSSTVPIIQTSLVLQTLPWDQQQADHHGTHPSSVLQHSSSENDYLLDDSRLRPAYYLIFIAILAYLSLTVGVPLADRYKAQRKEKKATSSQTQYHRSSFSDDEDEEVQYDSESMQAKTVENPLKKHLELGIVNGEERDGRKESETEFP
jgi:hypothetical protein